MTFYETICFDQIMFLFNIILDLKIGSRRRSKEQCLEYKHFPI